MLYAKMITLRVDEGAKLPVHYELLHSFYVLPAGRYHAYSWVEHHQKARNEVTLIYQKVSVS